MTPTPRKYLKTLTAHERDQMPAWAARWIDIGLRTGPADRERFEASAKECYRFAEISWPGPVVWVASPLVLALAASMAAVYIELLERGQGRAMTAAEIKAAVGSAVDSAVRLAVRSAVGSAVDSAVKETWLRGWYYYIGGQFWAGWSLSYWGPAYLSFMREVCGLELKGDLWARGRAYEGTVESACWWYPSTRFVMACERPSAIHLETPDPEQPYERRLHCETGPAIVWPDGWGIHAWHGIQVPAHVVTAPDTITATEVQAQSNAEVRRVMVERMGLDRFVDQLGAVPIHADECGTLYRCEQDGDEPLVIVRVLNSTPEPDGSTKSYTIRVHPELRPMKRDRTYGEPQKLTARNAVASTFGLRGEAYHPVVET